jgi:hypothetical protein
LRQTIIVTKPVRHANPAREPINSKRLSGSRSRNYPIQQRVNQNSCCSEQPGKSALSYTTDSKFAAKLPKSVYSGSLYQTSTCGIAAQLGLKYRFHPDKWPDWARFSYPFRFVFDRAVTLDCALGFAFFTFSTAHS